MLSLTKQLDLFLARQQQKGLYRARTIRNMQEQVNFSCNDYLSLGGDDDIKKAYQEGFKRYPAGSGGSMLVCGYHNAHQSLETAFARALGVDDCILFSSGYAACLSIGSLVASLKLSALIDKGVHASMYDGLRLAGVPFSRYIHNDVIDFQMKLRQINQPTIAATESIFSMSGQRASLSSLSRLAHTCKSSLIVDEAHAFGVIGREGLGAVIDDNLSQQDVPLRIIPFGKALASSGALIAGQKTWVSALQQCARSYIYSTAMSPALAFGLEHTLMVSIKANERRKKLHELIAYFRHKIKDSPYKWRDSTTPIQQLQLGCPQRAVFVQKALKRKGIICLPMREPTVSKKETGLRIILNYSHEPEQIDFFIKCLDNV